MVALCAPLTDFVVKAEIPIHVWSYLVDAAVVDDVVHPAVAIYFTDPSQTCPLCRTDVRFSAGLRRWGVLLH